MARIIMHLDLNAFFVTAEQIRNPELVGKPVLIGKEGRSGIVSTCSYEARKRGCHSGQPMFQAKKACPEAIVVEPDFEYYKVMSVSFFSVLKGFVGNGIEQASIDEAYVDMTERLQHEPDPVAYLRGMQFELKRQTGLLCSIGIAPTKWLAKMASDMEKPMGLVFIRRRDIKNKIYPLPIEQFWGIGKKTAPSLRVLGIQTIGDLAERLEAHDGAVEKELGKFSSVCLDWVRGYGSDQVDLSPFDPKSIGNEETLSRDCSRYEEIEGTMASLVKEVAERLQASRKMAKGLTVKIKDLSFKLHSRSSLFEEPTDSYERILAKAKEVFLASFDEKFEFRLLGVTVERLVDPVKETIQMNLWNYQEYEDRDKTKLLIHELNRKMEKPMLMRGSQAKGKKK